MDREELKKQLDEAGIEYDGRWGEEKLASLLNPSEEPEMTPESTEEAEEEPTTEPAEFVGTEEVSTGGYRVLTRLKHNGRLYEIGEEFDGEVGQLVEKGIIG